MTVAVREITCKSALNRSKGMPFEWGANPYRGCAHACTYCYARKYFARMGRDVGAGFDQEVEVRVNFADVLREELRRRPERGSIAFGTATDPYQPIEGRYRLMRRSLEALLEHPVPLSIVTKGTLVVRDRDLLAELSRVTDVSVIFSICTLDTALWRQIEPVTPHPLQRLRALAMLRDAGIEAGILLAPILPGLTDDEATLDAVLAAASAHGAQFVIPSVLKLDHQIRDYILTRFAAHAPEVASDWAEDYPGSHPKAAVRRDVDGRVRAALARHPMAEAAHTVSS
jgi:DNA repair photolyase